MCCRVTEGMHCPIVCLLYLLYCLTSVLLHSFTFWPMTVLEFVTLIPGSYNLCLLLHNKKPLFRLKLKLLLSCFISYFNAPGFPRYNHVHILNYKAVLKTSSSTGTFYGTQNSLGEATARTGYGTTDWFQIGKGVR